MAPEELFAFADLEMALAGQFKGENDASGGALELRALNRRTPGPFK